MMALLSAFLALPILATGCDVVRSVLPQVVSAVTKSILALDTIENFTDAYFAAKPDAEKQKVVGKALAKARAALSAAQHATEGAEKLDQAQNNEAWKAFQQAYEELLILTGPLGVKPDKGGVLQASPAGDALLVPAPEALRPGE